MPRTICGALIALGLAASPAMSQTVDFASEVSSASNNITAKCTLEVSGKTYISGLCDVSIIDAGSFIRTEKSRAPYFAYVIVDDDDKTTADGTWNKVRGADHAHAPLGSRVLHFADGCWSNESARVCWSRK